MTLAHARGAALGFGAIGVAVAIIVGFGPPPAEPVVSRSAPAIPLDGLLAALLMVGIVTAVLWTWRGD